MSSVTFLKFVVIPLLGLLTGLLVGTVRNHSSQPTHVSLTPPQVMSVNANAVQSERPLQIARGITRSAVTRAQRVPNLSSSSEEGQDEWLRKSKDSERRELTWEKKRSMDDGDEDDNDHEFDDED